MDGLNTFEISMLVIEIIIFIPTIFGNVLILESIRRFQWLQTPLNAIVGSLAVSDLLFVLVLTPGHLVGVFMEANRIRGFCLAYVGVIVTLMLVTLLNMLAISIERYYSVGYPWKHRAMKRQKHVKIFIPLSWATSFLFSFIPFMGWDEFETDNKCQLYDVWPMELNMILNGLIVVIICTKVVMFTLVVRIALKRLPQTDHGKEEIRARREISRMYMLIAVSAVFIFCWAPFCFITFFKVIITSESMKIAQSIALVLGFLNSALNWLIYGLKNQKFRHAFRLLLCKKVRQSAVSLDRLSSREISS